MKSLLAQLKTDYPTINFRAGKAFSWSSAQQIVYYPDDLKVSVSNAWSLLHEMGHATLGHTDFDNDFGLLQMEVEAWSKAVILGKRYGHEIDDNHIQDCLDTYRDWLHQRSKCPICDNVSLQKDKHTYHCFNCSNEWHVAENRHHRPYRKKIEARL